jgi:RNA recognition motif-containing protein
MSTENTEPEAKRRRKSRWESAPEKTETTSGSPAPPAPQQMHQPSQMLVPTVPVGFDCRIYVGSLYYEIKQEDVRALFSPFGPIRSIDLSLEPGTQRSKGYCFIEYETPAAAEAAMAMNNFELAGRNVCRILCLCLGLMFVVLFVVR